MFKTPFGNPAWVQISPNKKAVIGVISLGFATTQFPEANAGAIFQVNRYKGRFHGEMQPTTPSGCFKVKLMVFLPMLSCASLANWVIAWAKNLKLLDARGISTDFAKLNGFPLSRVSASANAFRFLSISAEIRNKISLRSSMGVFDHLENAFLAA